MAQFSREWHLFFFFSVKTLNQILGLYLANASLRPVPGVSQRQYLVNEYTHQRIDTVRLW